MKKSIKKLSVMIFTTAMILSSAFTSLAAWEQQPDGAWKYKDDTTNVYVTDRWIESESEKGLWYYIGANGVMAVNTTTPDGYYVNERGEWREGQTDRNNQGNTDSWKGYINLDDWDQGGGVNLDQDLLDRMEEGLNKIR